MFMFQFAINVKAQFLKEQKPPLPIWMIRSVMKFHPWGQTLISVTHALFPLTEKWINLPMIWDI